MFTTEAAKQAMYEYTEAELIFGDRTKDGVERFQAKLRMMKARAILTQITGMSDYELAFGA